MMTKRSVPGKLFLAGEYAITAPGHTAVIAATAMGLNLTVTDAPTSSVTSNSIATAWHFNMAEPITVGQTIPNLKRLYQRYQTLTSPSKVI